MKDIKHHRLLFLAAIVCSAHSIALEALDDEDMSGVTGQSGITITQDASSINLGGLAYTDDGTSLNFNNITWSAADGNTSYNRVTTLDASSNGELQIESTGGIRDFSIGSISLSGATNNYMGVSGTYNDYMKLNLADDGSGNTDFSGSQFDINFANLLLSDGAYSWIFTDMALSVMVNYGRLVAESNALLFDFGDDTNRGLNVDYSFSGIGVDLDGSFDPQAGLTNAYGSLELKFDLHGSLRMRGGGYTGTEGITFIPSLVLVNDDDQDADNSNDTIAFIYEDDGFVMLAEDFTVTFNSTNGITLDLETDGEGPYMALRMQDFDLSFSLDNLVVGGTRADYQANKDTDGFTSIGGFSGRLLFENGLVDIAGTNVQKDNYLFLRPGGMDGDGITLDVGWNIVSDDPVLDNSDPQNPFYTPGANNSYFALKDDGNLVYFNGFSSWGSGRAQIDLTKQSDNLGTNPAVQTDANGLYSSVYGQANGYDGYFDGLRISFDNVVGSYEFLGLTVGTSDAEAQSAPLQGGTELLLSLEIFPAYDFTLNGAVTLLPGDVNGTGTEGITFNGDFYITNASAALSVDETGRGVWLTDTTYDIHMRDASLTVDDKGLTLNKGLTWSKITVGDILFGDKETGQSLGQFELERLEDGTTLSIASGGVGAVCIGGNLNAAGDACDGTGRFEDRGDQGITVKLKMKFAEDDGNDPRYVGKGTRFAWTQPNGTVIALDNFSTSDGPGTNTNDYGLNIDLSIDVARTAVIDEATGEYVDAVNGGTFTDSSEVPEKGPLGFAVFGEIHFKQLNIDNVTLAASANDTPQTMIDAVIFQNGSIETNLTATPIR